MVEVKRSDPIPSKSIINFRKKYGISAMQLVLHLKREKKEAGIEIRRGMDFLRSLML